MPTGYETGRVAAVSISDRRLAAGIAAVVTGDCAMPHESIFVPVLAAGTIQPRDVITFLLAIRNRRSAT